MQIETLVLGALSTNCYLISDGEDVVVIDPAAQSERIFEALAGRKVAAVLMTHGHFDHTGALSAFAGTPIYMHPADDVMLTDAKWSVGARFQDTAPRPEATHFVQEGKVLDIAGMSIRVLHVPGHTLGSVCYQVGDALFTGDTLFKHGYGRVDHAGGDINTLMQSLKRLLRLPEDARVFPGHGAATTLFAERHP